MVGWFGLFWVFFFKPIEFNIAKPRKVFHIIAVDQSVKINPDFPIRVFQFSELDTVYKLFCLAVSWYERSSLLLQSSIPFAVQVPTPSFLWLC